MKNITPVYIYDYEGLGELYVYNGDTDIWFSFNDVVNCLDIVDVRQNHLKRHVIPKINQLPLTIERECINGHGILVNEVKDELFISYEGVLIVIEYFKYTMMKKYTDFYKFISNIKNDLRGESKRLQETPKLDDLIKQLKEVTKDIQINVLPCIIEEMEDYINNDKEYLYGKKQVEILRNREKQLEEDADEMTKYFDSLDRESSLLQDEFEEMYTDEEWEEMFGKRK